MRTRRTATREEILETLRYCPETGNFHALNKKRGTEVGGVVGYVGPSGYVYLSIKNTRFLAHRVAWFLEKGEWPDVIDHINGNPSDNRICNLRATSQTFNRANSRIGNRNSTGLKGVCWSKRDQMFRAQICFNKRRRFLGHFATAEEAHAAYCAEAKRLFGDFARFG